jgi:23S rRNA (adenine2030-N6)-methyltransferase
MNYRHAFHAGNFCDVVKHCILILLLHSFQNKEKGFCYMDTHAGAGLYDLSGEEGSKTLEWQQGIGKIFTAENPPLWISEYLKIVQHCPTNHYPGSPWLAKQLLRPQDKMVLCELHPEECYKLKRLFCHDKNIAIHQQDAYQALKALLPPQEKRGLVLIDPPFEQANEFTAIMQGLKSALNKFSSGCYAVWYPLKNREQVKKFHRELQTLPSKVLIAELTVLTETDAHLYGTGMAIVNPPWLIDDKLKDILPWLWQHLSVQNQGSYHIEWLKTES